MSRIPIHGVHYLILRITATRPLQKQLREKFPGVPPRALKIQVLNKQNVRVMRRAA